MVTIINEVTQGISNALNYFCNELYIKGLNKVFPMYLFCGTQKMKNISVCFCLYNKSSLDRIFSFCAEQKKWSVSDMTLFWILTVWLIRSARKSQQK